MWLNQMSVRYLRSTEIKMAEISVATSGFTLIHPTFIAVSSTKRSEIIQMSIRHFIQLDLSYLWKQIVVQ